MWGEPSPCVGKVDLVHHVHGRLFLHVNRVQLYLKEFLISVLLLSSTVLSENPTSFTITVTSEAGDNDESKLDAFKTGI